MAAGAVALGALFVAGAVVQVPRTQDDLTARVESSLAAAGLVASADFAGQDGTLRCAEPLADPGQAVEVAANVWGVRAIELDVSCGVPGEPVATTATTVATTTLPPTTVAPATVPPTSVPSTRVPTTTEAASAAADVVTVALRDGVFTLDGAVANDFERLILIERASAALSPSNVVNSLDIDPQLATLPRPEFNEPFELIALMPTTLVSGTLGWNGSEVSLSGTYVSDGAREVLEAAAASSAVVATLASRWPATSEQGAELEAELNALVAAQPILFDRGSVNVSLSSLGTLQQVAGIAKRYSGLSVAVQGHTDSEGDPERNLTLSVQRAAAVRDALIILGVPAAELTSEGFGITQLIRDSNGNEVPDKSRRVVFGVILT